jgi:hypothetical protein
MLRTDPDGLREDLRKFADYKPQLAAEIAQAALDRIEALEADPRLKLTPKDWELLQNKAVDAWQGESRLEGLLDEAWLAARIDEVARQKEALSYLRGNINE